MRERRRKQLHLSIETNIKLNKKKKTREILLYRNKREIELYFKTTEGLIVLFFFKTKK